MTGGLSFDVVDPDTPAARSWLRSYFDELITRRRGRPATTDEIERVMADEPSDDLVGGTGVFVLVHDDDGVVGCGGVRVVDPGEGELTRIFISPAARGRGAAGALLHELELMSTALGLHRLRLTVRGDLVEARRAYERAGYEPIDPFSDSPYADLFLAKRLDPAPIPKSTRGRR